MIQIMLNSIFLNFYQLLLYPRSETDEMAWWGICPTHPRAMNNAAINPQHTDLFNFAAVLCPATIEMDNFLAQSSLIYLLTKFISIYLPV